MYIISGANKNIALVMERNSKNISSLVVSRVQNSRRLPAMAGWFWILSAIFASKTQLSCRLLMFIPFCKQDILPGYENSRQKFWTKQKSLQNKTKFQIAILNPDKYWNVIKLAFLDVLIDNIVALLLSSQEIIEVKTRIKASWLISLVSQPFLMK